MDDALEVAWCRLWVEIRDLLPRHPALQERGDVRTADEARELEMLSRRLACLRRRTHRYREVIRAEVRCRSGRGRDRGRG